MKPNFTVAEKTLPKKNQLFTNIVFRLSVLTVEKRKAMNFYHFLHNHADFLPAMNIECNKLCFVFLISSFYNVNSRITHRKRTKILS